MEEKYFSTTQVAKILGISRIAVFGRIKRGTLHAIKSGRSYMIPKTELMYLIRAMLRKSGESGSRTKTIPRKMLDSISES